MSDSDNNEHEITALLEEYAAAVGDGELHIDDDGDDDDDEDMDDSDLEYYLDAEDIDEEMGVYEDDEDFYDEDDDDAPDLVFTTDPITGLIHLDEDNDEEDEDEDEDEDDDDEMGDDDDDGEGALAQGTLQELAALLNNAPNANARSSLLARLLAGPGPGRGNDTASVTRSGQVLRRMGMGQGMTDEERARALAERRRREKWWKPVLKPEANGQELLQGGEFGRVKGWRGAGKCRRAPTRSLVKDRHYSWTPTIAQVRITIEEKRQMAKLTSDRQPFQIHMGQWWLRTLVSHMSVSTLVRIMDYSVSDHLAQSQCLPSTD